MEKKTVSIGIATYNRSNYLIQTVKSILDQNSNLVIEIIIIDQTSDIDITKRLEMDFDKLSKKVRYFTQNLASVCFARNTIISKALGDIIIFYDDDVILGYNCVNSHAIVYQNPGVQSCIGHIYHRVSSYDIDKLDINKPTQGTLGIMPADAKLDLDYQGVSISCNQSFDRTALLKIGGFDENFKGGYYEDADLGLRLKKMGYRIAFHPEAMVLHLKAPQGGLRFEKRQPFSEVDRLLSFVLFYVRYPNEYGFKTTIWSILRAGPLRKPNLVNPVKHFVSWLNLIRAFYISLKIKNQVKSSLY